MLTEKEITAIKDLQTQEETCIKKYEKYSKEAKDSELKNLFTTLKQQEQKHYQSLEQVLNGNVPDCDCNDQSGAQYKPEANYAGVSNNQDKQSDCFLITDCIATEKLVSGEYNTDVFVFGDSKIRKLLADIQIEEQNHAEMLYKYKMANCMV